MVTDDVKKGTTTVGIVADNSVIMASEHRATMGNVIAHKKVRKVFKIDDNIALTTAGLVGDAQILARVIKAEVELYKLKRGSPMTVKAASTLLSNILRGGGGAAGFYMVGLIMGGVDPSGGHVYGVDAAGGSIRDDYISVGSGSLFAYGVLEDHYKEDINEDQGVNLAIRALTAAMKRDSASGNGITVAVINKDGHRELSEEELKERIEDMGLDFPKTD
ncbi:MAG: archaeal proteasome endopeptidase complex subunit beta [Methanomassiliicoccales archaeon]